MKNIEEKIWDSVAGISSAKEEKELKALLAHHTAYQKLHNEIKQLHASLKMLDLEEPSMAFQRKVINQIEALPTPASIPLVDKRIIRGIAAFFLLSISLLLSVLIYQTDWNSGGMNWKMPEMNWNFELNRRLVDGFIFLDLILGLYFLDEFLRKKWA